MRTTEIQRIKKKAWEVALHPAARRIEVILALQLVASCNGLFLPDINEDFLTAKQVLQLRQARSRIVETALRRKEKARVVNRRAYLKRRLRQLEEGMIAEAGVVAGSVAEGQSNGKNN
ncbi:MAG: hypothetical protein WB524_25965 [Acidobacteriaceae bacterium]